MLDFAKDKKLWERVRTSDEFEQHRREIRELYDKAFEVEPRSHSAWDILDNNDNGLWRLQFDHLQASALMALIYPDNEEYYRRLVETIWAYLNEYTWAPLGHYTELYYGVTPKDFDFGLIDIFASSVAFSLAEIKNLFKDRFPQLLLDRISYELRRRTIEPYLSRKYFWESHDNNWTAVCTGAVGGVLMYEAPELFFENQERLHKSMECYLASYNDDGMCVEGVGYWEFGFGFFCSFAMLERELTNGEVDWFKREKVKEISKFIQKTFLLNDVMLTFSDCSTLQKYFFSLTHMLRSVYGDELEPIPCELGQVVHDNTHFNFALRSVIYYSKDNIATKLRGDITYSVDGSCYLIKRKGEYGFAVKGGHNGESHNHIDCGTFILAHNGKQIICDTGAGPYEDGYHTDKRYTFFQPSAYAHSMPLFDGVGEDSISREPIVVHYDKERERASMDIAIAYGMDFVKSVKREFDFEKSKITLTDTFDLTEKKEITERFIATTEPKMVNGLLVIDKVTLNTTLTPKITVKELIYHTGGKYNAYIIDYVLPEGETQFKITFDIEEREK